ncbi:hypothetical protein L226DRAFT_469388 [Lentinus tigrinus ALCF2SS1-7]|uniref:Uncharacterized protein n=1 Tax=Lentinus tigrinus ALCF2SS1-6 TaxID=1328759 RepID=A0A5C2S9F7_9APHY|nr:hypothetical protein L227DRAFT_563645 [Lentinus tigrinus ALCF2SS1-6]RPD70978.1 hypothetical protein L226DRAFT_469388 [Lentinus tigrinus ALCF2SS1-7]
MRDVYLSHIRQRFPRFQPRHDFDILALGGGHYTGTEEGIFAWLDKELVSQVALVGDVRTALEGARSVLSADGLHVTGLKPSPGDAHVFIRPIPGSRYSIRLFPGSPVLNEFCMDFVKTATGQPVNSPFKFELWSVGASSGMDRRGAFRLRSLESAWGYSSRDILPGAEKFVLRDGMICVLKRPGHKPVRFTVPTRLDNHNSDSSDMDELDFPLHI